MSIHAWNVCVCLTVWVNTICGRYSVSRHTTHMQHPRVMDLRRPRLLGDHFPTLLCSRASSINYCTTPTDTQQSGQTHKSLVIFLTHTHTHTHWRIEECEQTTETDGWRMAVINYELEMFSCCRHYILGSEMSVEQTSIRRVYQANII